jgi:hypothetical protein
LRYRPAVTGKDLVDTVDPEVRGILLALQLLGAGESALAALGDRHREPCRQAWAKLRTLEEPARARTHAAWHAEATSAVPAGLSRLHPSWIEETLAGERPQVLAALRPDAGSSSPIPVEAAREIARMGFARLLPLCEGTAGPLAERLCAMAFDELLTEVARRGARAVGRSLAGAAPALRARAMASAGEPWAQEIAAGALETVSTEARAAAVAGASRALAAAGSTMRERLLAVGLVALKAELEEDKEGSSFRVAGRLPAPLGRALLGW